MSFLPIRQDNEEAPQGQTTNAPGQEGTQAPPETGGSVGDEGAAPAKGSATGTPTQFGSSASKLGDYLTANAPQIQGQADTLSNTLNTQYGTLNQGITDAANQFQQQVQGGYNANNPDVVNQAMSDPTKFASDPNNVSDFQGQYNNTYTGPTNFEGSQGYSDLQNQVGQATTQANLLGNQAGLQSYLQGQGTNPTQAMSTLDSLLLRGNPEAQAKINTAAGQFGNLTGQLGTATTGADQSVVDAQNAADASRAYAQGQINPYAQNFGNTLNQNIQTTQDAINAFNTTANQNISNIGQAKSFVDPTAAVFQQYGLAVPDYLQSYNQAPPSLWGKTANAANTASTDDYAKAQALQQLIGSGYQSPLDQSTIGQAGTSMPGAISAVKTPNMSNLQSTSLGDLLNQLYNQYPITAGNNQHSHDLTYGDPFAESMALGAGHGIPGPDRTSLDAYLRSISALNPDLVKPLSQIPGGTGAPLGWYGVNERSVPTLS